MYSVYLAVHDVLCSRERTVQVVQQAKSTLLDQTQQLDNEQVKVDVHDMGDGEGVANLLRQWSPFTAFYNGVLRTTDGIEAATVANDDDVKILHFTFGTVRKKTEVAGTRIKN